MYKYITQNIPVFLTGKSVTIFNVYLYIGVSGIPPKTQNKSFNFDDMQFFVTRKLYGNNLLFVYVGSLGGMIIDFFGYTRF